MESKFDSPNKKPNMANKIWKSMMTSHNWINPVELEGDVGSPTLNNWRKGKSIVIYIVWRDQIKLS